MILCKEVVRRNGESSIEPRTTIFTIMGTNDRKNTTIDRANLEGPVHKAYNLSAEKTRFREVSRTSKAAHNSAVYVLAQGRY